MAAPVGCASSREPLSWSRAARLGGGPEPEDGGGGARRGEAGRGERLGTVVGAEIDNYVFEKGVIVYFRTNDLGFLC